MAGARTALLILLAAVVAGVALISLLTRPSGNRAAQEADIAYCLAPGHQSDLVTAAFNLGLVWQGSSPSAVQVAGGSLPLGAWRSKDKAQFDEACDAVAAPAFAASVGAPVGDSGLVGLLKILLPLGAGSILTLLVDVFKQGQERRWVQAGALNDSWLAFRGIIEAYRDAKVDRSPDDEPARRDIEAFRRDLRGRLRLVELRNRKLPIDTLMVMLNKGLGGDLGKDWAPGESQESFSKRRERADAITDALDEFDSALLQVVGNLQRRF